MSRTAIFINNQTGLTVGVWNVDGHLECEQTDVAPGETAVAVSIGDPGGDETATTGNLWLTIGDVNPRIGLKKPKLENAEIRNQDTYGVTIEGSNDYPKSGSVYSKSLTLNIF